MNERILTPHAASLSQSMRDIGYSLETAIADIIDNSIAAGAENIYLYFDVSQEDSNNYVAIIDDGSGMTEDELIEAMRPGSTNPREKRSADDLGRFGLGLKTASFSQCKALTVISLKDGVLFAAQWDLDLLSERNEWVVRILSVDDIDNLPYINHLEYQGTYILWQKLDRLLENNESDHTRNNTYEKFEAVESHLALVFHRYISSDYKKRKLIIYINEHPIEAFDPFCITNKATQLLPEEVVRIDGHEVRIQPYILPHHSKLTKKEDEFYRSRSEYVSNQGAYVYRNGRLMTWGEWFRLTPKNEATKLARVRIDFPNALDDYWTIDIKKSRAHPPYQVRQKLRQIINRVTEQSQRVHIGRGNRLFEEQNMPLWIRFKDRSGIRYAINRDHPLIDSIENNLEQDNRKVFEAILSVIERSLPLEAIYADYSSSPQLFEEKPQITYDELKEKLENLYMLLSSSSSRMDKHSFALLVSNLKPFSENRDVVEQIIEGLV